MVTWATSISDRMSRTLESFRTSTGDEEDAALKERALTEKAVRDAEAEVESAQVPRLSRCARVIVASRPTPR